MSSNKIRVEVAYALPEKQRILEIYVFSDTTVFEAVMQSGIVEMFPMINPDSDSIGIFGKAVKDPKTQTLREGDRIEIYRPLIIDPKQARINRAKK
ncbi:MAG: RnfH family protein [Hahellaceae bacterium]|nr:RnfH family protein [Hahellaceae bacterium]